MLRCRACVETKNKKVYPGNADLKTGHGNPNILLMFKRVIVLDVAGDQFGDPRRMSGETRIVPTLQ